MCMSQALFFTDGRGGENPHYVKAWASLVGSGVGLNRNVLEK